MKLIWAAKFPFLIARGVSVILLATVTKGGCRPPWELVSRLWSFLFILPSSSGEVVGAHQEADWVAKLMEEWKSSGRPGAWGSGKLENQDKGQVQHEEIMILSHGSGHQEAWKVKVLGFNMQKGREKSCVQVSKSKQKWWGKCQTIVCVGDLCFNF